MKEREYLWVEKYRPHTVADCILPDSLRQEFQAYVDDGKVPNLILSGDPGRGKTTVAKAMIEEIGSSYLFVSPLDLNLDKLRTDIEQFASSVSLNGKRKYVIIDEADGLNPHIQPQLRAFIESFSATCGFILTCNNKAKLMEALKSRCPVIDFVYTKKEYPDIAKQMLSRLFYVMDNENVTYDRKVIIELVKLSFPSLDFRKIIANIQRYATRSGNNIDSGILVSYDDVTIKNLIRYLKEKEFSSVRKWVNENEIDDNSLFRRLYDAANEFIKPDSIPALVLLIAKYQYQAAFAADKQLNLLAFLIEVMVEIEFL